MRAPRIRVKPRRSLNLRLKQKTLGTSCTICQSKTCVDEAKECERLTRSGTKWINEINNNKIIIYETYRCMPLLGDERVHAPDWEEHIVKYHIVIVKNK